MMGGDPLSYLAVMLAIIVGILIYGKLKENIRIQDTGFVLISVWAACAMGYVLFVE